MKNVIVSIGILIDKKNLLLWQYKVILQLSMDLPVDLYFIEDSNWKAVHETKVKNIFLRFHNLYERLVFGNIITFDRAINLKNLITDELIKSKLDKIPILSLNDLKKSTIDFLLDFSNSGRDDYSSIDFKKGVISYKVLSSSINAESYECYMETVEAYPEIEIGISLYNKLLNKEVLLFKTGILPYPNSFLINRSNVYNLACILIPRVIKDYFYQESKLPCIATGEKGIGVSGDSYKTTPPGGFGIIKYMLKIVLNYSLTRFGRPKIKSWYILINKNNSLRKEVFSNKNVFDSCIKLRAPKGLLWADPFVLSLNNNHYVFVEEYVYRTDKAHISVLELDNSFRIINKKVVIDKPYHLSYPHIFKFSDTYYMVPETGKNNTIELYKCIEFPYKWEFCMNLMENIQARDTTLFYFNNKWWMFSSISVYSDKYIYYNELYLFYSDDLFTSEWTSHPNNPIVTDHKLSRQAGNLFMINGSIFRPSQDCSGSYGRAININKINRLSETDYDEIPVNRIEPDESTSYKGIHTFNFNEGVIVVDVFDD